MIPARALPWRGAMVAGGVAAAIPGPGAMLFALGMPHGAGDLLPVRRADRAVLIAIYLLTGAALPLAGPALPHAPELAAIFEETSVGAGFAEGPALAMRVVGAGLRSGL